MNKYEKKIDKALKEHENHMMNPEHNFAWIYHKLGKWHKKDRLSEYWINNFIERIIILTEDTPYD